MIFIFLEIHEVRPHAGQKLVASRIRSFLHSEVFRSEIAGNKYSGTYLNKNNKKVKQIPGAYFCEKC